MEHKLLLDERQTEKDNKEVEEEARRNEEARRKEEERIVRQEKMRMMEMEMRKREQDTRLREEVDRRRAEDEMLAQKLRDEYELQKREAEAEYQRKKEEEIQRMREAEESLRIKQEGCAMEERKVEERKVEEAVRSEMEHLNQEKEDLERSILEDRRKLLERERDQHRMRLEEIEREIEEERVRLLRKRDKQEENMLRKSVTFKDQLNEHDLEVDHERRLLNGTRPLSDDEEKYREDFNFDKFVNEKGYRCNHSAFAPPRKLANFMRRRPRSAESRRPEWKKYWSTNSIPDIIEPPNHGAFRETALNAPLEARDLRRYPYACEWTSPVYKYVDPYAKSKCTSTVEQLMRTPKPPEGGYQPAPPLDIRVTRPMSADAKEAARREYRRVKVAQRNHKWNERLRNEQLMKEIMQDNHRERILAQMERDRQRLKKEKETVEQAQKAKKYVSAELRAKMEKRELENKKREQNRIEAMRQRREHREAATAEKQAEEEKIAERRKEARIQRSQQRWDNVHSRLQQEEAENQVQGERIRNAKINRIEHFQKLEAEGQQRKDVRIKVSDQHLALLRSQVLP